MSLDLSLELIQKLFNSKKEFPVDFDLAWKILNFSRKDHGKEVFFKAGFEENLDYVRFTPISGKTKVGRPSEKIWLTLECFKTWGMMANTDVGRVIRKYYLECERILKEKNYVSPDRLDWLEERQLGIVDRNEATHAISKAGIIQNIRGQALHIIYAKYTDKVYMESIFKTASQILLTRPEPLTGDKKNARLRLTKEELEQVKLRERAFALEMQRTGYKLNILEVAEKVHNTLVRVIGLPSALL